MVGYLPGTPRKIPLRHHCPRHHTGKFAEGCMYLTYEPVVGKVSTCTASSSCELELSHTTDAYAYPFLSLEDQAEMRVRQEH